jgi:hypothetical protein
MSTPAAATTVQPQSEPLTIGHDARATYSRTPFPYVWHLCDAVLTAPVVPTFRSDAGPRRRRVTLAYHCAHLVINALAALLPRAFAWLRARLLDAARLPFRARTVQLLSAGSGVTVFLMQAPCAGAQAHVLKIYRKSLGRRLRVLLAQAEDRRARYNRIASWYDECGVVLPTQFLLVHGPVLRLPALAYMQPYVDAAAVDVFTDLAEPQLLQLLIEDRALRQQFRLFVERTLRAVTAERACVDIVGRNNLVITTHGGERRLVLLDYGILDFAQPRHRNTVPELQRRLEYLQRMTELVRVAELGHTDSEIRVAVRHTPV